MEWKLEFFESAIDDLDDLDPSVRKQVLRGIEKVAQNPLPKTEGGRGWPLGNHAGTKLAGCLKIKYLGLGLRTVYLLDRRDGIMHIIIVSVRDDDYVYKQAVKRLRR